MSHRKVLSQGNVPFSWEEKPGVSKFCFRDFQALALHSTSPTPSSIHHTTTTRDSHEFHLVSKIPPPPCRLIRNASANSKGNRRWELEEDPFLVAYKECTKSSVKNGKFVQRSSRTKAGSGVCVLKKSKLFGFSCKSIDSCEVRDDTLLQTSYR